MLVLMLPLLLFAAYDYHSVRKGDTLYGLSKRYGVSVEQIRKLNDLQSDNLSIGQKLKIKEQAKPKPRRFTAKTQRTQACRSGTRYYHSSSSTCCCSRDTEA